MLMVVLGAGASYDGDPRRPPTESNFDARRLPLAKHLFHDYFGPHATQYPACIPLLSRLRSASSVETELEAIRSEIAAKPFLGHQLEAIRFYIWSVISQQQKEFLSTTRDHLTNYIELVQEVEGWRHPRNESVVYITFNYDTLLDAACEAVIEGYRPSKLEEYVTSSRAVIKLHGSIDWEQEIGVASHAVPRVGRDYAYENGLIEVGHRTSATGKYLKHGEEVPPDFVNARRPAIAIPLVSKTGTDFACPKQHVDALEAIMPHVTHVLVIGWRGEEEHFHALWLQATAQARRVRELAVVDVTDDSASGIADKLNEAMDLHAAKLLPWGGGFTASIGTISDWLEAF